MAAAAAAAGGSLESRAAPSPLAVTLSDDIKSCSPMTVTWDASKGQAPWTITVAPVNQLPVSVTIPTASSSSSQWQWNVPNYPDSLNVIVAVSDATGAVAGTSSFSRIATSSSSCSAPASDLDFVWFPRSEKAIPQECGSWEIQWQVDSSNSGITPPVQFVVLAERMVPLQYAAGIRDTSWNFPVVLPSGTDFVIVALDDGKSGTGGVGEQYTVGSRPTKCTANANVTASPGLVAAKSIGSAVAASSSATASSSSASSSRTGSHHNSTKSGAVAATPTSSNSSSSSKNAADDSSSSSSSSNGGAIAGAVVGCLLAAAIVAGLFIFWRRRKTANGGGSNGRSGWPAAEVMPWKWEVVDDEKRNGNGGEGPSDDGHHGGGAAAGAAAAGAGSSFAVHHVRKASGANMDPTYAYAASGTDAGSQGHHVSKPSLSSRNIYSVVPDEALFPPPGPASSHHHQSWDEPSQQRGRQREVSSGSSSVEGRPPRPPVAKVVPDSMLFPPPPPASGAGTPVGGIGAGVGTYAAMNNRSYDSAHGSPSLAPGQVLGRNLVPRQPAPFRERERAEDPFTSPERQPSTSQSPPRQPASTAPPSSYPISTSIHDPYSHMSRIYNDPIMAARMAELEREEQDRRAQLDSQAAPPGAAMMMSPQQARERSGSGSQAPRLPPLLYPGARGKASAGEEQQTSSPAAPTAPTAGGLGVQQLTRKPSNRSSMGSEMEAALPYL
ncbi:hypothetical protein BDZ90DRAFT_263136 [Jaminaea rosea]|uniref:Uncharacterized protein n=1 Tax=Jaminaea rosea TaxID=1569628 RepID=A0A316UHB8_9BASI|nr:hypothetical protein BDZ90DRAFT_263136 [Jaminaea rosea]PWN24590.1 hypothetical protein BDZ90DRAFT_263136 [Jaminaea rosea]